MRRLRWLYHRWRWRNYQSWRVIYPDGQRTVPLSPESARSYAHLFGGRVEWARDAEGNLLP